MNFLTGLLTTDASNNGMSIWIAVAYVAIFVVIIYIFTIRPERKRRKEAEELRASITVGDTITTIGGIVGKVVDMKDDFLTIETSEDRVRVELAKWAVSTVGKKATEDEQK